MCTVRNRIPRTEKKEVNQGKKDQRMRYFHRDKFQVKRKTDAEATPQPEQSVVPAIRLKIPDNAHKEFEKGSGVKKGAEKTEDTVKK